MFACDAPPAQAQPAIEIVDIQNLQDKQELPPALPVSHVPATYQAEPAARSDYVPPTDPCVTPLPVPGAAPMANHADAAAPAANTPTANYGDAAAPAANPPPPILASAAWSNSRSTIYNLAMTAIYFYM